MESFAFIIINSSGNWIMGQNTPQAMEKDVLDTLMPHAEINQNYKRTSSCRRATTGAFVLDW